MIRSIVFIVAIVPAGGFVGPSALRPMLPTNCELQLRMSTGGPSSRAQFVSASGSAIVATAASVLLPGQSVADEENGAPEVEKVSLTTTKLGGQLEPFSDVAKGYRCAKPLGWNRYDGTSSEYVVKLVDLVDPTQVILLTNSPVKSETQLLTLGTLQEVGQKLSKGRGMELRAARERLTEGIRLYDFELRDKSRVELRTLAVNKNKLWNLTLGCSLKAWPKREEAFRVIVTSFLPRL